MRLRLQSVFLTTCATSVLGRSSLAQQQLDARQEYERLICIVPMIGAGTYEDPKRRVPCATTPRPAATIPSPNSPTSRRPIPWERRA
jgi:hypothetical protein